MICQLPSWRILPGEEIELFNLELTICNIKNASYIWGGGDNPDGRAFLQADTDDSLILTPK